MSIETTVNTIADLNPAWPTPQDLVKNGDDHIRLVKDAIKKTFPQINKPITVSSDALNALTDNVQVGATVAVKKDVDLTGHSLKNVSDPTAAGDGVNKVYVDRLRNDVINGYVNVGSEQTVTGLKRFNGGLQATTSYTDGRHEVHGQLLISGVDDIVFKGPQDTGDIVWRSPDGTQRANINSLPTGGLSIITNGGPVNIQGAVLKNATNRSILSAENHGVWISQDAANSIDCRLDNLYTTGTLYASQNRMVSLGEFLPIVGTTTTIAGQGFTSGAVFGNWREGGGQFGAAAIVAGNFEKPYSEANRSKQASMYKFNYDGFAESNYLRTNTADPAGPQNAIQEYLGDASGDTKVLRKFYTKTGQSVVWERIRNDQLEYFSGPTNGEAWKVRMNMSRGGIECKGESYFPSGNGFRILGSGSPSSSATIFRSDETSTYILLTDGGDNYGNWSNTKAFPLIINHNDASFNMNLPRSRGNQESKAEALTRKDWVEALHSSDIKLKSNIHTITDALNAVNQLNGYTFTKVEWPLATSGEYAGVIAQEVEKVLPQAVKEAVGETDSIKTVDPLALCGLLIEAVKTLTKRVEELEAK